MHGPSTIIIEQALIGALLYYPEFRSQLAMLPAEDLSDATAKRAWRAMTEMHAAGRSISPVTLYAAIGVSMDEHDDPFAIAMDRARIGQKPEILDLVDGVRNEAGLRRLGHLKAIIEHEIYAQGARADTVVAELAQELSDIEASLLPGEETFVTHEDAQLELIQKLGEGDIARRIPTDLTELDQFTGGLTVGDFHVLGGSSSMGKTAFATQVATNAARAGHGVLVVSLEMSRMQLSVRIASEMLSQTDQATPYQKLTMADQLPNDHYEQVTRHLMANLSEPLCFDVRSSATLTDVRVAVDKARRWLASKGLTLDLLVVDYLNLMQGSSQHRGNKVAEIGEILRGLKAMAKREQVALLLLAQLNRGASDRDGRADRPTMAHLRDSGEIEMHADSVWFTYREAYNLECRSDLDGHDQAQLAMVRNQMELIIGKQRMGATGYVELWCDLAHNVIRDREDLKPVQEAAE